MLIQKGRELLGSAVTHAAAVGCYLDALFIRKERGGGAGGGGSVRLAGAVSS